jgi:hypothetical protein
LLGGVLVAASVALLVGTSQGQLPARAKKSPVAKDKAKKAQPKKAQPKKAQPKKAMGEKASGTGCFNLFQPNATGPDKANAYLLMLANYYIYGDADNLGAFRKRYETQFRGYGMKALDVIEDAATATRAVVMSNDKIVVVSFRGTEPGSLGAWVKTMGTDIQVRLVTVPWLPRGAQAHEGFAKALDKVYRGTANAIAKQGGFRQKKVFVTGHSLGGALAVLCAARLQGEGRGTAVVHTFGAPRPGNQELQRAYRCPMQRWVNFDDVVPMVPDEALGYRHLGTTNNIGADGTVRLNDQEYRGPNAFQRALEASIPSVGLAANAARTISGIGHHTQYLQRMYGYLPANQRQRMPALPK